MTAEALTFDSRAIHSAFQDWSAAEDELDTQLSESLAALAAYQSHLDEWQSQLANEREALRESREKLQREREATEKDQAHSVAETNAELSALQHQNLILTSDLTTRSGELRDTQHQRDELAGELELARGRESELQASVEQLKQALHQEREQAKEEIQALQEKLHQELSAEQRASSDAPALDAPADQASAEAPARPRNSNGAVLGSIVEQFGKLRQQRAIDRQAQKKAR